MKIVILFYKNKIMKKICFWFDFVPRFKVNDNAWFVIMIHSQSFTVK